MEFQNKSVQNQKSWEPITPGKPQSANENEVDNQGNSNAILYDLNLPPVPLISEHNSSIQSLLFEDNVDLCGISCTELLGLATADYNTQVVFQTPAIDAGVNQCQFLPQKSQIDCGVTTNFEAVTPGKEKEKIEVPPNSENKKRKRGLDDNKKPGEKRQFKYFWAKIATPPKPKTPAKPKTPKPTKAKTPNPKTPKAKTPKAAKKQQKKEVKGKRALNFEHIETTGVEKEINYEQALKVYQRRDQFKLQNECRRIEPSFLNSCKKKMTGRIRKPVEELKPFHDFNYDLVRENLHDQIVIKTGKTARLLSTKGNEKVVRQSHQCVWSLLASRVKFLKKKRSIRRKTLTNTLTSSTTSQVSPLAHDKGKGPRNNASKERNVEREIQEVLLDPSPLTSNSGSVDESQAIVSISGTKDESKTIAVKKAKKPRAPYKRKEKVNNELNNLKGWNVKSFEEKMDILIQHFVTMSLYDDPTKHKLEVILSEHREGEHSEDKENPKFKKESSILLKQMKYFLYVMTNFQGSKKFVPWNGSVLDSVIGVFLTQNVSDVLSSTAYMNLASLFPIKKPNNRNEANHNGSDSHNNNLEFDSSQGSSETNDACQPSYIVEYPDEEDDGDGDGEGEGEGGEREEETPIEDPELSPQIEEEMEKEALKQGKEYRAAVDEMTEALPCLKGKVSLKENGDYKVDWESIRLIFLRNNSSKRDPTRQDSVDWDAVRKAPHREIANAIRCRGQFRIIAMKLQKLLNDLVKAHGTLDVEWLRQSPAEVAKAYLLQFYGIGLKSVECLRLLTLRHDGFPVDVNIGRIAVRLGWVPLQPLPFGMHFHLIPKYPLENEIQQYLWPRMKNFKQKFLYEVHYQMITFGKIFCMKRNPNCGACPFKKQCKYYESKIKSIGSKNPYLPRPKSKSSSKKMLPIQNPFNMEKHSSKAVGSSVSSLACYINSSVDKSLPMLRLNANSQVWKQGNATSQHCEPIIDFPESPKKNEESSDHTKEEAELGDIEDLFKDDQIFIKLGVNTEQNSLERERESVFLSGDVNSSTALVSLSASSMPLRKLINHVRLRTEHQVYELPYNHPLLRNLERQHGDIPYLLAIWMTKDETQKNSNTSEGSVEDNAEDPLMVKGTILIPVRTAMRGSFPLNGTYFQINEVFADYETTKTPINVPTSWIWNLRKRTLYCGSGTSSIFRDLSMKEIRDCCCKGFICTRAFDRRTRSPKLLPTKFHYRPPKVNGKLPEDEEDD